MSLVEEGSEDDPVGAEPDPEALGPSTGTVGWVVRACSYPPLMKYDDECK